GMAKRNQRNRRHGTNELAADSLPRKKGRLSPTTNGSAEPEYTMIDLVRSVERLHYCKSGERRDSVLWADVKKHYKKITGRVLTTEEFNKLAGLNGVSRKEIITGPLAGLVVADDPAALVLHFKYDATKGDPLINHRFYLEAAGAKKTSVHHASDAERGTISPRFADITNTVSPSRSGTASSSSLSPTCLSSISTDPDTEASAFSLVSAASPLSSSAPISPDTREFVTANDELAAPAADGDTSFLTARTSPITSDWDSSPSRAGTATPHDRSGDDLLGGGSDQEKTLNLSDHAADMTVVVNEILIDMDRSVTDDKAKSEGGMEKKEEEMKMVEDESDKENHVAAPSVQQLQPATAAKPVDAAADDVIVDEISRKNTVADDAIVIVESGKVPEAVEEVVVETTVEEEKEKEEEVEMKVEQKAAEEEEVSVPEEEHEYDVKEDDKKVEVEEEEEVERRVEEKGLELAAGDGPTAVAVPPSSATAEAEPASPVTTCSSDEALLTVIERVTIEPLGEHHEPAAVQADTVSEMEDTVDEEKKEKVEEPTEKEEKSLDGGDAPAAVVIMQESKNEEEKDHRDEVAPAAATVEETAVVVEEEEVEEMGVSTDALAHDEQPVVESKPMEDTVEEEKETAAIAVPAAAVETHDEETVSSASEEPTATTMVAVAPATTSSPILTPPHHSHEPMETISLNSVSSSTSSGCHHIDHAPSPTSDDVDMNDILAVGPNREAPSVTAPITLQPKPTREPEETEVITSQPVEETDAMPRPVFAPSAAAAAVAPKDEEEEETEAVSPDQLALRRAAPPKKFPCCTIV
ncbi:hypothetical protein PFISCL1PPCAC_485, partial [Pristionchus fissidentatus]